MKQFFAILLSAAAVLACTKTPQEAAKLEAELADPETWADPEAAT